MNEASYIMDWDRIDESIDNGWDGEDTEDVRLSDMTTRVS